MSQTLLIRPLKNEIYGHAGGVTCISSFCTSLPAILFADSLVGPIRRIGRPRERTFILCMLIFLPLASGVKAKGACDSPTA